MITTNTIVGIVVLILVVSLILATKELNNASKIPEEFEE
jgi:hypothetical protein